MGWVGGHVGCGLEWVWWGECHGIYPTLMDFIPQYYCASIHPPKMLAHLHTCTNTNTNTHAHTQTHMTMVQGGLRLLAAGSDRAFRVFSTIQDQQSRELSQKHTGRKAKRLKVG